MTVREVVISGIGVVAPNGIGRDAFLTALQGGVSGIDEIRSFDTTDYSVHRGGEVKGLEAYHPDGGPGRAGRTSTLILVAAREAMEDAGLRAGVFDRERAGVLLGTTSGEVQDMETVDEAWTLGRTD